MTAIKPRLLDLFCCAGGAARGYQMAGFHVTGIDIKPQPRYAGDVFVQGDALEYVAAHGHEFDVIHASPPCQGYSASRHIHGELSHPLLIDETRRLLQATSKPYVIENVEGAPLLNPIVLCGIMFGLKVYRHRLFETNPFLLGPAHTSHPKNATTNSCHGYSTIANGATHITAAGHNFNRIDAMKAMRLDWDMTREEVAQAIPPSYTEYIGRHMLESIEVSAWQRA